MKSFVQYIEEKSDPLAPSWDSGQWNQPLVMTWLKKLLKNPLPIGNEGPSQFKNSARSKLYDIGIGDSELWDDIDYLRHKKGEKADARPVVKKWMKKKSKKK